MYIESNKSLEVIMIEKLQSFIKYYNYYILFTQDDDLEISEYYQSAVEEKM